MSVSLFMLVRPVAKSVTPAGNSTGDNFHCNSLLQSFFGIYFLAVGSNFTRSKDKIDTYFHKIKNETFDLIKNETFDLVTRSHFL